jgi:hypothetical protein
MSQVRTCVLVGYAACSVLVGTLVLSGTPVRAQSRGAAAPGARAGRPSLFLSEAWKQNAKGDEHPVAADAVANPDLELRLYGPSAKEIQLTGAAGNESNPIHVWTGMCTTPCGLTLRHKASLADLTGLARIRWNTKVSGVHQIRPLVKLADGTMYVADKADGAARDWLFSELFLADLKWLRFDPARAVPTGAFLNTIDLSAVDEIGFVDLMPGSGHGPGGWSDLAQFEVYGRGVPRVVK